MINKKSIYSVESRVFNSFRSIDPNYNLVNIPGTIINLFGGNSEYHLPEDVFGNIDKRAKKVALFVIDAFGYESYMNIQKTNKFLQKINDIGVISKLTTQFPSTTTVNITTFQSGLPLTDTGVIEWYYYEPILDQVYNPLTYKFAKTKEKVIVNPELLLPFPNLYQQLNGKSYVFQYELYNNGPYANWMNRGSTSIDFKDIDNGLDKLKEVLAQDEQSFSYFYIGDYDEVCHDYGPYSDEANYCIEGILNKLEDFVKTKGLVDDDILCLITADHGQTTVNKEKAVYLNREFPEIIPYLKKNNSEELIVPCGSFRDMFLHVKPGYIDFLQNYLSDKLRGKAEVFKTNDLINLGIFGSNPPSKRFLDRVGDIVIVAYKDEAIWWYEENNFFVKHKGMHGGLLKEEMEIPLIVFKI